jgi:hypothetical protein
LRPDLLEYAVGSLGVAFGSLEGEIESPQLVTSVRLKSEQIQLITRVEKS